MTILRGERITVLSPHLDDAVFSLGGAISATTRAGKYVRILTVFAGDPGSTEPAGWWDRATGFETHGEAARRRREEDVEACALLGATPCWLPFGDATYVQGRDDDAVWSCVAEAIEDADTIVLPGFPLVHPDHAWLTGLVLGRVPPSDPAVGLYVEQPYAWRHGKKPGWHENLTDCLDAAPVWLRLRAAGRDRGAKRKAFAAYASQIPMFGRAPILRIALYEARRGGESVAWLPRRVEPARVAAVAASS